MVCFEWSWDEEGWSHQWVRQECDYGGPESSNWPVLTVIQLLANPQSSTPVLHDWGPYNPSWMLHKPRMYSLNHRRLKAKVRGSILEGSPWHAWLYAGSWGLPHCQGGRIMMIQLIPGRTSQLLWVDSNLFFLWIPLTNYLCLSSLIICFLKMKTLWWISISPPAPCIQ